MAHSIHRFPWGTTEFPQVWIVQFGSKSTPLIAQLCREIGFKSRILGWETFPDAWRSCPRGSWPKLVILSGGEDSVYDEKAPTLPADIHREMVTFTHTLGICYGAQLLAKLGGGEVARAAKPEYSQVAVWCDGFGGYRGGAAVMNHGDEIVRLPPGWKRVAYTERCEHALVGDLTVWAVQFHPEMDHTEGGEEIVKHVAHLAGCRRDYSFALGTFVDEAMAWMRETDPGFVLCGLSGGVDSSVAFRIGEQALGARMRGVFVDTGWVRDGELEEVRSIFGDKGVTYVRAEERFHDRIEAVAYPETGTIPEREGAYYEKVRKAIGATFIDVFADAARFMRGEAGGRHALIQGTNAADIVESETGLKAHHNVGGLPAELGFEIVEPLAGLYKFEIRELASHLGLPDEIVHRQPFPGPGLAIRSWGKLSREDAPPLRVANGILEEVMRKHYPDPRTRPCQYYCALAKLPSTGLMGDRRVIGYAWWVRMVASRRRESYATLGVFRATDAFHDELAHRLTSETRMPDGTPFPRVAFETTGKPPSTTEPH